MKRIAVLRALQLGDLLVAVPALRSLRVGFPDAEITLIGLPWARDFVHRFGHYLDRFVPFPGYPGLAETEPEPDPEQVRSFFDEQRRYAYDLVIQMHGSGTVSNRIVEGIGGHATAGYYEGEPPGGLTVAAPYPDDLPEVLRNLELVRLLGCPRTGLDLEFPLFAEDRREAVSLLYGMRRPIIGLHPGSRSPARRWPAEYFAAAADDLARRFNAGIILTGVPTEREIVREVAALMETDATDLAGKTTLGGLAAVIADLDLFLCNSTGPSHIADAVGTPSVTIFGASDPRRWAALDRDLHPIAVHQVPCSPCAFWECPIDHPCLRLLEPAAVVDVATSLLTGVSACNA